MKKESNKYRISMLCIFIGFWLWSLYNPASYKSWLNENYFIFFAVPILILLIKYFKVSNLSVTLVTIFFCLHTVAAHYGSYINVPFGFTIQQFIGADRNMYDRFVHFLFGFLMVYPIREVFMKISKAEGFWTYYIPIDIVLSFSALFELMELAVAKLILPGATEAFMGFQNDFWDSSNDILNAFVGSIIATILVFILNWFTVKDTRKEMKRSFIIKGKRSTQEEEQFKKAFKKVKKEFKAKNEFRINKEFK